MRGRVAPPRRACRARRGVSQRHGAGARARRRSGTPSGRPSPRPFRHERRRGRGAGRRRSRPWPSIPSGCARTSRRPTAPSSPSACHAGGADDRPEAAQALVTRCHQPRAPGRRSWRGAATLPEASRCLGRRATREHRRRRGLPRRRRRLPPALPREPRHPHEPRSPAIAPATTASTAPTIGRSSFCRTRSGSTTGCGTRRRPTSCRTSGSCATTPAATAPRRRRPATTRSRSSARTSWRSPTRRRQRVAFCGLSLGGMIGQWLAAHAPDRVTHLVLANTTARVPIRSRWRRAAAVLEGGMAAVDDTVMGRFFSPAAIASGAPAVASARRTLLATDPVGYAGCCAAIRDMDQTGAAAAIAPPTLVISGDVDVGMPWDGHGAVLAATIPGAHAVACRPRTSRTSSVPASFTRALLDFLAAGRRRRPRGRVRGPPRGARRRLRRSRDRRHHRLHARASGADHRRYPWGTIWTRPGLDHRTRRLLVLTDTARWAAGRSSACTCSTGLAHELEPARSSRKSCCRSPSTLAFRPRTPAFHIATEELKQLRRTQQRRVKVSPVISRRDR